MGEGKPIRRRRRWIVAISAVIVAGLFADYHLYPLLAPVGGQSKDSGENGLWLRYIWYFGQKTDGEIRELGDTLHKRRIRYAYFHVRSIQRDGSLKYRNPDEARRLTDGLRRSNAQVKPIAWIYAGNSAGKGDVRLDDERVRRRMVEEAAWLCTTCGFDGVQWDYEICPDGDPSFIKLLDETRRTLPKGKLVSVAAECSYPGLLNRFGWSDDHIAEVSQRCDQLAVMCYDSGAYTPRLYVWFVRRQASVIPRIAKAANAGCKVILGLPTYGPAGASHNPKAENLRLGLKAVREADGAPDGVALFADYTTDGAEWAEYDRFWAAKPGER